MERSDAAAKYIIAVLLPFAQITAAGSGKAGDAADNELQDGQTGVH